jgi:hypothetical protein
MNVFVSNLGVLAIVAGTVMVVVGAFVTIITLFDIV